MPNIGSVLDGYDIFKGNPKRTTEAIPDPGFRNQHIFQTSFSEGRTTLDGRYLVPNHMDVKPCRGDCSMSFVSKDISGMSSYQSSLDRKVSLDGSGFDARFSASLDYKRVEDHTEKDSKLFIHSEISCCSYVASLSVFDLPPFTENFKNGLKSLSKEYDVKKYRSFVDVFGTHFVKTATMGAIYGQQSEITHKSWTRMVDSDMNIDTSAGYSGMIFYDIHFVFKQ